jgi:predicted nucleotidyltransferase
VDRQLAKRKNIKFDGFDREAESMSGQGADSLVSPLRKYLPAILAGEPVQLAYLYGSSVTGQMTPFSDVDVALVVGETIRPLSRLKLTLRVQLALADRCGIENADVRVIDDAPLVFRGRLVSDGVLVYARDEGVRVAFETATRMQYFDYLPIHRALQEAFFRDVREQGLHG